MDCQNNVGYNVPIKPHIECVKKANSKCHCIKEYLFAVETQNEWLKKRCKWYADENDKIKGGYKMNEGGIDEATAKKPIIVKEDTNEKNVKLLADMHIKNLKEIKYRHNRAIEYAMYKTGKTWESNRTRLSFYEYFEESLRNEPKELGGNQ